MITVLLTGFGAFPGVRANPSELLVERLARLRRPAFADIARVAHVFSTSYGAVDQQLPELVARHRPDAIIMFGLASRTRHLRIETQARNQSLQLLPDVTGFKPPSRQIRIRGPSSLGGRAAFSRLLSAVRATGSMVRLSRDAGNYVCNYAYWRAIEKTALLDPPPLVVFVHVPRSRASRPRRQVACGLERRRASDRVHLVRAGEAVLRAVLAGVRTRSPADALDSEHKRPTPV